MEEFVKRDRVLPHANVNNTLTDVVAGRYDAGVRLGEETAKDTIAVRIGPEMRMPVVGAHSYFARRPLTKTPQGLTHHACIKLRLTTLRGLHTWDFGKASGGWYSTSLK
jgi:DNA-binding transcriptional LysR family regulator